MSCLRDTDEPTFIRKLSSKEEGKGGRTKAEVAWLNSRNAELVGVFRRLAQEMQKLPGTSTYFPVPESVLYKCVEEHIRNTH
eukprot:6484709-Amphidinium_carterae.1